MRVSGYKIKEISSFLWRNSNKKHNSTSSLSFLEIIISSSFRSLNKFVKNYLDVEYCLNILLML